MISAAVLAGGKSTRMGRDKALLELSGRPLVRHVIDRLGAISHDVFLVTKRAHELDGLPVRVVSDDLDAHTPLAGIARALHAAAHQHVFVCACDMPFVSPSLVRLLADRVTGYDAAVPLRDGRPEPLHAVWSCDAVPTLDAALRAGERAVHRVLDTLHVAWIDEDTWAEVDPMGLSFQNVNTPDDLARVSLELMPDGRAVL